MANCSRYSAHTFFSTMNVQGFALRCPLYDGSIGVPDGVRMSQNMRRCFSGMSLSALWERSDMDSRSAGFSLVTA